MNAEINASEPVNLPAVAPSGFPVSYEEARNAIAKCESRLECRTMADQAAAMAVYAKMRDDTDLRNRAVRLQAWAARRWGEIDKALHPDRRQENLKQGSRNAADHISGGKRPASPDGTTEYQRVVSRRLAAIPESEFSRHVENPSPLTVTALAALGTQTRPKPVHSTSTPSEISNLAIVDDSWAPDGDEVAVVAQAEREYSASIDRIIGADDTLAAAHAEIKRQADEIATLTLSRDGFVSGKCAISQLLKTEQERTEHLTKEVGRLEDENEALRERIAIMEVG